MKLPSMIPMTLKRKPKSMNTGCTESANGMKLLGSHQLSDEPSHHLFHLTSRVSHTQGCTGSANCMWQGLTCNKAL
eukprot:scaffold117908_cov20-Tisochrysis_lutea.AAC.2